MFHKLFQRAFPGWFPYNSLHTTQPMFTRKMNEEIAREIGTIDQYTLDDPSPPPTPLPVVKHSQVTQVLKDQANFRVIWTKFLNDMIPGKTYDDYMLGGDKPANTALPTVYGSLFPTCYSCHANTLQFLWPVVMKLSRRILLVFHRFFSTTRQLSFMVRPKNRVCYWIAAYITRYLPDKPPRPQRL